jgi:hypothetical protein
MHGVAPQIACFIVRDAIGQALAYVYFEDAPGRRVAAKLLTRDEARRIAANIVKVVSLTLPKIGALQFVTESVHKAEGSADLLSHVAEHFEAQRIFLGSRKRIVRLFGTDSHKRCAGG